MDVYVTEFTLSTLGDIIVHDSLVHYRANTWIDVQFLVIKKKLQEFLSRLHKNPPQLFSLDLELHSERMSLVVEGPRTYENKPSNTTMARSQSPKKILCMLLSCY
jgi:hypothetical protein